MNNSVGNSRKHQHDWAFYVGLIIPAAAICIAFILFGDLPETRRTAGRFIFSVAVLAGLALGLGAMGWVRTRKDKKAAVPGWVTPTFTAIGYSLFIVSQTWSAESRIALFAGLGGIAASIMGAAAWLARKERARSGPKDQARL